MNIRSDFAPSPWQLNTLLEYALVFERNKYHWSHLKHKEDFSQVDTLDLEDSSPLDAIYAEGAQMASDMSYALRQFNNPDDYPTLTSFLRSSVIENIINKQKCNTLSSVLREAECKINELNRKRISVPWAIKKMLQLFERQIELLEYVRICLIGLEQSDIYKRENLISTMNVSVKSILDAINKAGKQFESSPALYNQFNEEELRNIVLVTLSGIPYISAFGEVFHKKGKTDILVCENEERKFIAECKFWRGKKSLLEALDQLIGYLTSRIDDAALIIFVDNISFDNVIRDALDSIQNHPCYIKFIAKRDKSWFAYKFNNNTKEINLSLMIYHIPSRI